MAQREVGKYDDIRRRAETRVESSDEAAAFTTPEEKEIRHCGHGGPQGGRRTSRIPGRQYPGLVTAQDAMRRALARARRRGPGPRSDHDAASRRRRLRFWRPPGTARNSCASYMAA